MRRSRGFTLLELLIAVAIFALIGAMAYGGLDQVMRQKSATEAQAKRLSDLQKAYRVMQRDLEQVVNREIRNEFGDSVDALVGGSGFAGVEFSRTGRANPAGFLRSQIQRVSYLPDQDQLLRRTWRVLDRAQDSLPDEQVLVEKMQRFTMRFLDETDEWKERWPPQPAFGEDDRTGTLPRAVEVQIEIEDFGLLSWIFVLPEPFVAGARPTADDSGANGEGDAG